MPSVYNAMSRRESWPPTQVHINPFATAKDEPRPLLEDIDDDPLTYFLTPAPGFEDDGIETSIMDFDAGIEDTSHPREIVRSVSPSSLTGTTKPKLSSPLYRPATPEFDSDVPTTDDEDEEEDYITADNFRLITLSELAIDGPRLRRANKPPRSPLSGGRPSQLPSRGSFPQPSQRGRGSLRPGAPQRNFSSPTLMRARHNRLWREPSPDVWAIEEETEEEMMSEMGGSFMSEAGTENDVLSQRDLARGGKMVKKVRFVLPE
jgi:hypothetical protein